MSEDGDYKPGIWAGHDFASARRSYDAYVGRSYSAAVSAKRVTKDLIAENVSTKSTSPVIIVIDQTGSMGDWPATIFSKLPYLENEGKEYLGDDFEICFMAIGDAHNNEDYPLQVRPFAKGLDLKKRLGELVIEGKGGGQTTETYELAALFAENKVSIPNAIKPIIIFIGDEEPYDTISPDHAKDYMGIDLQKTLTTKAVFEKLKEKYSVYIIRKPYGDSTGNCHSRDDERITNVWEDLVGADHIANLPDPNRVVDVIFGILAKETGRINYFEEELEERQLKDAGGEEKVKAVYKSLVTIHKIPEVARGSGTGKSVMRKSIKKLEAPEASKKVQPLI